MAAAVSEKRLLVVLVVVVVAVWVVQFGNFGPAAAVAAVGTCCKHFPLWLQFQFQLPWALVSSFPMFLQEYQHYFHHWESYQTETFQSTLEEHYSQSKKQARKMTSYECVY